MSTKPTLPPYMLPMREMFKTSWSVFTKEAGHIFGIIALMIVFSAVVVGAFVGLAIASSFFEVKEARAQEMVPLNNDIYLNTEAPVPSLYGNDFETMTDAEWEALLKNMDTTSGFPTSTGMPVRSPMESPLPSLDFSTMGIVTGIVFLIILIAGNVFLTLMMILFINGRSTGKPLSFSECWKLSMKKYLPFLGTNLVIVLISLAPSILGMLAIMAELYIVGILIPYILGLPLVFLAIYWNFAPEVSALENTTVMNAIKGSYWIVRGRWWNVIGYTITFQALLMVALIPFFLIYLLLMHWSVLILIFAAAVVGSGYLVVLNLTFYYRLRDTAVQKPIAQTATPVAPVEAKA